MFFVANKMKSKIYRAILGLFLLAVSPSGFAENGPKLVCEVPVYQFGRTNQAAVVTHVFMIRNEGDTTFVAGMPRTTCGCTKARISKRMIGPGETAELTAVFTAARQSGEQKKTIHLLPYGSDVPAMTFHMEGFVEPNAESHYKERDL